ncbi:MAG TPA: antibiotic biosynthesis monooxygenase [Anaeromyxobacteraceae bacterium]|nr:antibiotic biosynthesis monooxygenase [Anaeromyxobacteraceae bacterium]
MISRHWRGLARPDRASDYEQHLREDTFPKLREMQGFLGASILRRQLASGVEYLVVSEWRSLESIAQFAGEDVEAAVVPANVRAMMIEYDSRARHYEVVERNLLG